MPVMICVTLEVFEPQLLSKHKHFQLLFDPLPISKEHYTGFFVWILQWYSMEFVFSSVGSARLWVGKESKRRKWPKLTPFASSPTLDVGPYSRPLSHGEEGEEAGEGQSRRLQ